MSPSVYDVLLLDVSNIFFSSFCAVDYVSDAGVDLSALYGTLNQIQSLIKLYNPTFMVAVFDGKYGSKKKRKIFPGYKDGKSFPINLKFSSLSHAQQIEYSKKAYVMQLYKFGQFMSLLPIYTSILPDREADETLAYIREVYFNNKKVLIVSNDKDYHQLIDSKVHVKNRDRIITPETLKEIWGTSDRNVITLLRCIIGDASDKLGGLQGFQLKSIQKYFPALFEDGNTVQTVDDFMIYAQSILDEVTEKKVKFSSNFLTVKKRCEYVVRGVDAKTGLSNKELLERNYKLMQLHDVGLNQFEMLHVANDMTEDLTFSPKEYKELVIKEGLVLKGAHKSSLDWEMQFRDLFYNQTHNLVVTSGK